MTRNEKLKVINAISKVVLIIVLLGLVVKYLTGV